MAVFKDIPKAWRWMGPWSFTKRVVHQIAEDRIVVWATALAYTWLFAIFPLFIFLLTLVPYLPENLRQTGKSEIFRYVDSALPRDAANILRGNITMVMDQLERPHHGLGTIGIALTLWAASAGISTTMSALDACYDVERGRSYVRQRFMAMLLTLVVATLVVAVVVLLPVGTVLINWLWEHAAALGLPVAWIVALQVVRWMLALLFMFTVLAIMYRFGPSVRQRFILFTPGAVFTVAVWVILGLSFRIYINRFAHYDQTYGTVGGVAVLLLLFYLDALVLLVGAEINSEMDFINTAVPIGGKQGVGTASPVLRTRELSDL